MSPTFQLIFLLLLNLGFGSQYPLAAVFFHLNEIKPRINISPMDQTNFLKLRTTFLCENAYGCMTVKWLIIQ